MGFLAKLVATARLWWRVMRMQRVTREGWFYLLFTLAVGVAAINTGNNLLYLVLGLLVSVLLLSAFLSETVLAKLRIERELPPYGVVGQPLRVGVVVENRKRRLASHSLVISELGIEGARTYVARVGPRESVRAFWTTVEPRRGLLGLRGFRITTRFPFGLFEKSRELFLPESLPIHPLGISGEEEAPLPPQSVGQVPVPMPGQGLDFHALREYRQGDDLRQIHWKATAKTGRLFTVEKEREHKRRVTLLVDTRPAKAPEDLDGAADRLVGLSRRLVAEGCEVGLRLPDEEIPPGTGRAQLLRIADRAARLAPAAPDAPAPQPFPGTVPLAIPLREAPAPPMEARPPAPRWIAPTRGRLGLFDTQRASLFLALLLAFGSLLISGEMPALMPVVFLGAMGAAYFRQKESASLSRLANILTLGALFAAVLAVVALQLEVMVVAPTFVVLLAAFRLLARKGPGDDVLLLLMALMMLAGGAALTGDMSYGLLFAAFAVVGTIALATTHLRREVEAVGGPMASRAPGSVTASLLAFLGGISLFVLVGSLTIFIAFPRVSVGLLARSEGPTVGGGGDRIELGGVGVLKDNPTPVMRVRFLTEQPREEIYWRTGVFDRWDGRGWSKFIGRQTPVAGGGGIFFFGRGNVEGIEAEIDVLRDVPTLPSFGRPISLRFFTRRGQPAPRLASYEDGTLEVRNPPSPLRYRLRSALGEVSDLSGAAEAVWLHVPPDLDPRVRELAASFSDQGSEEALIRSIVAWLQRENRYTLELPGEVEDPLAHFLFERKEGHCEFFATALTMLLRLRGIPARVVTGYYGISWVGAGGYWVVREGDAHAWTEAFLPGRGWVRFDATPAAERPGLAEGPWASLVEWVDVWRMRWANWVLDFDSRTQGRLMRRTASVLVGVWGFLGRGRPLLGVFAVAVLAGAVALLGLGLRRAWEGRANSVRGLSPDQRRAVSLFRRVRARLRARGIELGPAATAAEWLEAARRELEPPEAAAVDRALRAYQSARFGSRPLEPEKLRQLTRNLP